MSKELEALENLYIAGDLRLDYVISKEHKKDYALVEKALNRLEELEKAFASLSKEEEKVMKELSKEIEKNKELNEVFEFIKYNISYTRALCDRTKSSDNDLICFDIRGLVDEKTWQKIYKAIGTPII